MAKAMRFLAVETMKVAKSGYLGMPICMADVATRVASSLGPITLKAVMRRDRLPYSVENGRVG